MKRPSRKAVPSKSDGEPMLVAEWLLHPAATLGSSVRARGIERELAARQSRAVARCVKVEVGRVILQMAENERTTFERLSARIARKLEDIEAMPVLPREAEDILSISARERHKWLADGRLRSAGTRTVKLKGRARAVTFHVFDPRHIEDVLDRDLPSMWREDDAVAAAENRRRAAARAAATRAAGKAGARNKATSVDHDRHEELDGWGDFDADGLLR